MENNMSLGNMTNVWKKPAVQFALIPFVQEQAMPAFMLLFSAHFHWGSGMDPNV
jgi:hypothetical protein